MAEYTHNKNSGSAFPNYSKEDETQIESFSGTVDIEGSIYDIKFTEADSNAGQPYLRVTGNAKEGDDVLSGAALVYKPRDGSEPGEKSPQYTGPMEINRGHPNEVKKRLSIWVRKAGEKAKNPGREFFSIAISDPKESKKA